MNKYQIKTLIKTNAVNSDYKNINIYLNLAIY